MAKITIAGTEHDVPDTVAPIIQEMQATNAKLLSDSKAALEALNARAAEAEAKAKAEADAKTQAEIAAAAKAGDYKKAAELAKQETEGYATAFRDEALAREIENHPALRKTTNPEERKSMVADIVAGLRGSASYDLSKRSLVLSVDGKPAPTAEAIDAYLAARPYLRDSGVPAGSGASGTKAPPAAGPKRSAMTTDERGEFIAKHGKAAYLALPE